MWYLFCVLIFSYLASMPMAVESEESKALFEALSRIKSRNSEITIDPSTEPSSCDYDE